MSIYVRDADGNRQLIAGVGLPGPPGKSAYQYAVEGGFSGTEDEFRALMGVQSNGNLLDNAYFRDPINQRGQTEYVGSGYTIDRWSNARTGTVSILGDCLKFDGSIYFYQKFEDYKSLAGKTLTFSVLYTSTADDLDIIINDGIGQFAKRLPPETSVALGTCTFTMSKSSTTAIAVIGTDKDTSQYKIYAAKLELGPVQTLAHQDASGNWVLNDPPPNRALELAKCQKYQLAYHIKNNSALGIAQFGSPEYPLIIMPIPTSLRTAPIISHGVLRYIQTAPTQAHRLIPANTLVCQQLTPNALILTSNTPITGVSAGSIGWVDGNRITQEAGEIIIIDANL